MIIKAILQKPKLNTIVDSFVTRFLFNKHLDVNEYPYERYFRNIYNYISTPVLLPPSLLPPSLLPRSLLPPSLLPPPLVYNKYLKYKNKYLKLKKMQKMLTM